MRDEVKASSGHHSADKLKKALTSQTGFHPSSLRPHPSDIGQTPDLPATHVANATVAPFPAWRGSQGERCAEPEV